MNVIPAIGPDCVEIPICPPAVHVRTIAGLPAEAESNTNRVEGCALLVAPVRPEFQRIGYVGRVVFARVDLPSRPDTENPASLPEESKIKGKNVVAH